jgi:hypothetical protein
MVRPDATSIPAQMIDVIAFWDWTHEQLVSDPMSTFSAIGIEPDLSITAAGLCPRPFEAVIMRIERFFNALNEAIFKRS